MNNAENTPKTNEHNEWITVANASRILGVSKQAVRQRIYRDTILHRKEADGTVYVRITEHNSETNGEIHYGDNGENASETNAENTGDNVNGELVDELRDRLAFVERQLESEQEANRENRRIIAGLVQRVPELEAAQETRDGPERASKNADRVEASPEQQEPSQHRSWLYRFFFGP